MPSLRQLIVRWIKARVASKTSAQRALQPLRHEELAQAVGGVAQQSSLPNGTW
jgi:hypothetical protein